MLSWTPAAEADHYIIEWGINGLEWTRSGETTANNYILNVTPDLIHVRVAAVGLVQGDWISQTIGARLLPIPGPVQGLALAETFTGTQAHIKWNETARCTDYKIEVWAGGVLKRSVTTNALDYIYRSEDAVKDGGPWRNLTFKLYGINASGISETSADLIVNNPAPTEMTGITVYAGYKSLMITYDPVADTDFAGVRVCMSITSGFTPPLANVVYEGSETVIVIPDLPEDVTQYIRLAAYDKYGTDSIIYTTTEYSSTPKSTIADSSPADILNKMNDALADLGVDLLVNGDFSNTDLVGTGWVASTGLTASVVNGQLELISTTPYLVLTQLIDVEIGKTYLVGVGYVSNGAYVQVRDDATNEIIGNNTINFEFTAISALVKLRRHTPSTPGTYYYDNISVKEIVGNGNLILTADKFAVKLNGSDTYPLIIANIDGTDYIGIAADVVVEGNISASQLTAGSINAGTDITVGNGAMVLSGDGAIVVYDGDITNSNRDFAFLSGGELSFQQYWAGAYHEYKSVKRVEYGAIDSGLTATLPGYWKAQPKLIVSPNELESYQESYSNQSQKWHVLAQNLREDPADSGIYKFDAVAELILASNFGTDNINQGATQSSNTWNSSVYRLPNNTSEITVDVSAKSKRGAGTNGITYYYRKTAW